MSERRDVRSGLHILFGREAAFDKYNLRQTFDAF